MKHNLTAPVTSPAALGEVIDRLNGNAGLDAQARREMISAVNAVSKFAHLPPMSVRVDVSELRQLLEQVQPGQFKLSARRLTNIRSLFVKALVLSGVPVEPLRLGAALSPGWAVLIPRLTEQTDKSALARFSQWCSLRAIGPEAVTDGVVADYRDALLTRSFILNGEKLVQNLVRSWNRALMTVEGWPATKLTVMRRREVFMLAASTFPESFQRDLDAWCHRLAGSDPLDEQTFKPLRAVSVKWHRDNLLRCASALTRQGVDPAAIADLSVLVELENAKLILRWFLARNPDGKPSKQTHDMSATPDGIGQTLGPT